MITLKNDFLTVTIAEQGAELTSVRDNHTGIEYMWQADPAVWKRHAPVLFPIVGALKNDEYTYKGKTYHMTQHGFARDNAFDVTRQDDTSVELTLTDSEATRENYPFHFVFHLSYTLVNNGIKVGYTVENPSTDETLIFGVGGHPGFNIPLEDGLTFEDYYLAFDPRKSRIQIPLTLGVGIDYANRTLAPTDANLQMTHDFFANDAVIYEPGTASTFSLKTDKSKHGVGVKVEDAAFVGIWSPKPVFGDFICIEPWWGIADTVDATGELTEKFGMNHLPAGETFAKDYTIEFF